MHSLDDTIVAIATAPGGAARGIVRISGPDAVATVIRLFEPLDSTAVFELKTASRVPGIARLALDGGAARSLPCDLYLWPTARSYTRQPVAELHTFGSPPLLEAIVRAACAAGARLAEPGEFTLRAFLAGRIDLVQAEAVLGVIDAADRRQLDVALAQLAGGVSDALNSLRDQLLYLLADLEAGLDFAEEDISFVASDELERRLTTVADTVARLLDQMRGREQTDAAPRVVLLGEPNAGKSSLFNALVGRPGALVCAEPGTTRDYLCARLEFDGIAIQLIDTAGIDGEVTADAVSSAAQRATREQTEQADLRLLCIDAACRHDVRKVRMPSAAADYSPAPAAQGQLVVITKCDLTPVHTDAGAGIATSAVTGAGLDELKAIIRARLLAAGTDASPAAVVAATAGRCRESLRLASDSLARALELATARGGEELIAIELRAALVELGKTVGAIYTDDLLDRIFSRFCIGK
jgi:tRNA modification GTPase